MCIAKPGLRCSSNAWNLLEEAEAAHASQNTPASRTRLDNARKAYLVTPAGIRALERQGKIQAAAECKAHRDRLLRLHRFTRPLNEVDERWHGHQRLTPEITEPLVRDAYRIAVHAHRGIDRKNGEPYINHPLRVARRLRNYSPVIVAIALMHDAVEDSDLTLDDLRSLNMPEGLVRAVDALTKREGEEYMNAVIRAAHNPLARLVKLCDNLDNSSPSQLACFSEEKREKQTLKYRVPRLVLAHVIREHEELRKALLAA